MTRARILILSDYAGGGSADTGGAGIVITDSFRALQNAGADVRLAASFGDRTAEIGPTTWLDGKDLRSGGAGDALRIVYNPASRAAVRRLLHAYDPADTVVILHQWTRYLTPSVIGLLSAYRTMIYMHDYFWACPNGAYFDFVRREPCWRQPLGPACVLADCDRQGRGHKLVRLARHGVLGTQRRGSTENRLVLHISELARRTAETLLPHEDHALIYNPLDLPPPTDRGVEQAFDVGYIGRLEPEKGVGQLLDLVARKGLRALFVGEGSLAGRIEATAGAQRVGWQPHSAMTDLMRRCRVVSLPSLWPETWGLVTPEAINAGVPVLVSRRSGSAEMIDRLGGGAVFDPAVPGDMTSRLDELLRAPAEPDGSKNQRRHALSALLSPAAHAQRIGELIAGRWGLAL